MSHSLRQLLVIASMCFVLGAATPAAGDNDSEVAPGRRALVIGNSAYQQLEAIPSSAVDARRMAELLRGLGFEVTEGVFESVRQLEDDLLVPFKNGIRTGDMVVVYFSGHGFANGAFNYLAPVTLPRSVSVPPPLTRSAVPVESLQDFFSCRPEQLGCQSPGLLVFILDACRSFTRVEVRELTGTNKIFKGGGDFSRASSATNVLIGFAAEPGVTAEGTAATDQPSTYTRYLLPALGLPAVDLEKSFDEAATLVRIETNDSQHPGLSDWSTTDAFLQPSPQQLEDERTAWRVAFATGTRKAVAHFLLRHAVSRQAALARRWLDEHLEDVSSGGFTLVSPLGVDMAWRPGAGSERLAVRRTELPLAFPRQVERIVEDPSAESLGLVASGTSVAQLRAMAAHGATDFAVESFAVNGKAVLLEDAPAFAGFASGPERKPAARLAAGTSVRVLSLEARGDNEVLLQAEVAGFNRALWVPITRANARPPVELGRSLREVRIAPADRHSSDLVDPALVLARLDELRSTGHAVTWVSIAAGEPAAGEAAGDLEARVAHLRYALREQGMDGKAMTVVIGAGDVPVGSIRVRIFGYTRRDEP